MPIYEYICRACRHQFESLVLRSSAPPKCPACQSGDLEQILSTCAVHSEGASQANLRAAHRKVAAARDARQREEHQHLHEHFEDHPNPTGPHSGQDVTKNEE